MLDKFLAPHTHEAAAYFHLTENGPMWHMSVDESLMSGCASYSAFNRYIAEKDLMYLPATRVQLESILRSYAHNAIHNVIAASRSQIREGGYSQLLDSAEKSIRDVLNTGDNTKMLLALHQPKAMASKRDANTGDDTKMLLALHQPKAMASKRDANTGDDTKMLLALHQPKAMASKRDANTGDDTKMLLALHQPKAMASKRDANTGDNTKILLACTSPRS